METGFSNLNSFIKELKLVGIDNAYDAWFEAVGHMNNRGVIIPKEYEYYAGAAGDGTETDSYFHEIFLNTSNEVLIEISTFLFRYCGLLSRNGY